MKESVEVSTQHSRLSSVILARSPTQGVLECVCWRWLEVVAEEAVVMRGRGGVWLSELAEMEKEGAAAADGRGGALLFDGA